MSDLIIGIDLGTSTTEAAVYRDGRAEMILNLDENIITPSVVGLDASGNWVVGEKARAQLLLSPERTAMEVKRKMGSDEEISLGQQKYTPVELSAKILEYVRHYASEALGEDVNRAVISVPAYFSNDQRQATVEAGNLAGFQVERILNEPTAAALSYGLEHLDEESNILVYDLGGGTFDVTLLEMFAGVLEVKASAGDNQLGGKDFDERLMKHLLDSFEKKTGVSLREDAYAMVQIKDEAEKCKKALSEQESYHVLLPMIAKNAAGQPLAMDEQVTREQFEEMTRELMERTHAPIQQVLSDGDVTIERISQIILVGGSTRMPMVARDIEAFLKKAPSRSVNPDYAVSEGAAIQAGIISGAIDPEESLVMTDVNSYSLGVRAARGLWDTDVMSVIIRRNTTIPVTKSEQFYTIVDHQEEVLVQVYQGESSIASSNHLLDEFSLKNLPPLPAGSPVDIEFTYNINGILEVRASMPDTSVAGSMEINMVGNKYRPGNAKDRGQNAWDVDGNEDWSEEDEIVKGAGGRTMDVSGWKEAPEAGAYRAVVRRAERLLGREDLSDDRREELEQAVYELKVAIIQNSQIDMDETEEILTDLLTRAEG